MSRADDRNPVDQGTKATLQALVQARGSARRKESAFGNRRGSRCAGPGSRGGGAGLLGAGTAVFIRKWYLSTSARPRSTATRERLSAPIPTGPRRKNVSRTWFDAHPRYSGVGRPIAGPIGRRASHPVRDGIKSGEHPTWFARRPAAAVRIKDVPGDLVAALAPSFPPRAWQAIGFQNQLPVDKTRDARFFTSSTRG
jgi:hypothetical protein